MNYKDDYLLNYSENVNINKLEEKIQNLTLAKAPVITNGNITGKVKDQDGKPALNATVKVFDLAFNPIKHVMTNSVGAYNITSLLTGNYIIYAIKDGYNMSSKVQVTIKNSTITLADIIISINNAYTKGSIYGTIYDKDNKTLSNVTVMLKKTIEEEETIISETNSTTDGEYVMYDLDSGTYKLDALNEDYALSTPFNIEIRDNTNLKEKIYLEKLSETKEGTINGIIKYIETEIPLEGAYVGLYQIINESKEEILLKITTTNREGKYFFGNVSDGTYKIKAKLSKKP